MSELLAFSIIYEQIPVKQTSHPINSKSPIRREPLANQIPTGLVFIDKLNNNLLLGGNLPQIMENAIENTCGKTWSKVMGIDVYYELNLKFNSIYSNR